MAEQPSDKDKFNPPPLPPLPGLPGMGKPSGPPMGGPPGFPPLPGMSRGPGLPGMTPFGGAQQPPAAYAPQPPAQALPPSPPQAIDPSAEMQKKVSDLEKRLQDEREKVLRANLKSQEEKAVAAQVETSIKDIQEKLRRDRRDAVSEESRLKNEAKITELENRLSQERETWVSTLKTQVGQREIQDRELESHFTMRIQEMERRWLEEKTHWQHTINHKEEELRKIKGEVERVTELEASLAKASGDRDNFERRVHELVQENAQQKAQIQAASERDREYFQVKAEMTTAREQARMYQERFERDLHSMRTGAKEREQRLLGDNERLQHDLATAQQRIRIEYEAEVRRVQIESDNEIRKSKAQTELAGAALQRMRAVGSALEKQVASLRMQAEEAKKLKEEVHRVNERYKAEFLVLQRKWQDREGEIRKQAERSSEKKFETEKVKLKLRAQEEIQNRILKVQEQLRKEQVAELSEREKAIRAEMERHVAEKAQRARQETETVRRTLEAEIERKADEASRREKTWQDRMVGKETELVALRSQIEEAKRRVKSEGDLELEAKRARLDLERDLAAAQEKNRVLFSTMEELKKQSEQDRRGVERMGAERSGNDGRIREIAEKLEKTKSVLAALQDDKVGLQEMIAKVEAEHSRQMETWRRKVDLVRRDLEARNQRLEEELASRGGMGGGVVGKIKGMFGKKGVEEAPMEPPGMQPPPMNPPDAPGP